VPRARPPEGPQPVPVSDNQYRFPKPNNARLHKAAVAHRTLSDMPLHLSWLPNQRFIHHALNQRPDAEHMLEAPDTCPGVPRAKPPEGWQPVLSFLAAPFRTGRKGEIASSASPPRNDDGGDCWLSCIIGSIPPFSGPAPPRGACLLPAGEVSLTGASTCSRRAARTPPAHRRSRRRTRPDGNPGSRARFPRRRTSR